MKYPWTVSNCYPSIRFKVRKRNRKKAQDSRRFDNSEHGNISESLWCWTLSPGILLYKLENATCRKLNVFPFSREGGYTYSGSLGKS
jgi:hypothetical protein